jgi:rhomboid protease GluP
MVSRAANFGKRAVTPTRAAVRPPRGGELPDSRPASVLAALDGASPARPIAVAPPGLVARLFSRLPWFTFVLSYVLVCRFNAETAAATDWNAPGAPGHFTLLAMGAVNRTQVAQHGEWWRLFTATALHGSTAHLVGNLVTFVIVGFLLEPMIGIGWFAAIYFTGGFTGAMLSMMLNPADMLSVGASGAIMASLAALFALSFHTGARRPRLMRRVAGFSLFPALLPSIGHGAITDINAHLGGTLAGTAIAFLMLIVWHEDEDTPPGRSLAAVAAGAWVALTVYAFSLSHGTYAQYARAGIDYIRPADMPKDVQAMKANSFALVEKYPHDPRSHLFRGIYFLEQNDASDAEPYFRSAIALSEKSQVMGPAFHDWTQALLALDVRALGRADEAGTIAAKLCARSDLDSRTQSTLESAKLCN